MVAANENIIVEQSIELDCPPGGIRPYNLFPSVIEGTGLEEKDFKNTVRLFGHFTWQLVNKDKSDLFQNVRYTVIKDRVTKLYHDGYIRFGSW